MSGGFEEMGAYRNSGDKDGRIAWLENSERWGEDKTITLIDRVLKRTKGIAKPKVTGGNENKDFLGSVKF